MEVITRKIKLQSLGHVLYTEWTTDEYSVMHCHGRRVLKRWQKVPKDPGNPGVTQLFNNIIYNKLHVLNHILPDTKDIKYHLRPRTHNLKLTVPFLKAIL